MQSQNEWKTFNLMTKHFFHTTVFNQPWPHKGAMQSMLLNVWVWLPRFIRATNIRVQYFGHYA